MRLIPQWIDTLRKILSNTFRVINLNHHQSWHISTDVITADLNPQHTIYITSYKMLVQ